ncbi:alanine/ornithine racemase family PLP-dependent enzyme [Flagellimonas allohymeniacidonis]|uniref:Alanine/ornithine racemase family PLP-dependent enzyme n=1 Tax=Flagellimonas allohymeniacidonis TaxID=2517819 RepID=A0A4Q8QCA3_9FLAO|nr:alanine/ornithine racemase family PLP-dependent enzyme [Allomuricauda hymeniacidonis]TAI47294.1 alanine/ornithine racemase family PLP-dependent enzyme [Allomuricauda hymeniacidonis]
MNLPRIDIDLGKIAHNTRRLKKLYGSQDINIIGVTKVIAGNPIIADILVKNGIEILADSRISNIIKMRKAGIRAQYLLLRTPALSQVEEVVIHAHISLNSELAVLKKLSEYALRNHMIHKVVLMVELGDLREGIMPSEMNAIVKEVLNLDGLALIGIGTNLACFGGISPDADKMNELSSIAIRLEEKFKITLAMVSGGNSANYNWFTSSKNTGRINSLRLGESIFLGREALCRRPIPGLFTDIFTLLAEVIEAKRKPSQPYGEVYQNANGDIPRFKNKGLMNRAVLAIGTQDVMVSGITPKQKITVLGASSDHLLIDNGKTSLKVGDTVAFDLNYSALLRVFNTPCIAKNTINQYECESIL